MVRAGRATGAPGDVVNDGNSRSGTATLARGKVITTADQEIIGLVHVPMDFRLELDFGALTLSAGKLRSITFAVESEKDKPTNPESAAPRSAQDVGRSAAKGASRVPVYFRQGKALIVISSVGDRAILYDLESKKSQSLEMSGSKESPLEVTPILIDEKVAALSMKGKKVTRIAVADIANGTWRPQELRAPIDDEATPIVAPGVVVYMLDGMCMPTASRRNAGMSPDCPRKYGPRPLWGPGLPRSRARDISIASPPSPADGNTSMSVRYSMASRKRKNKVRCRHRAG